MVGFFSTRGQSVHSNCTDTTANSSSVDATSSDSETNNTALGIMVLYITSLKIQGDYFILCLQWIIFEAELFVERLLN